MNHSAYIFGNFERGYSQYPDDYAVSIFQDLQFSSLKANTQIAIHKDGNLIYYAYYRVLKNNQYIGLSLVFNGVFCKDIEKLFHLFEESITGLAVSGKIIEFSESGDLHTKATKLYLEKAEIDKTMQVLDLSVNQLPSSDFKPLPPVNLGVEKSDIFSVSSSDFNKHSVELLSAHNKLLVLKNQDYDSAQMSGFSKMLNSLYKEKLRLQEENNNLIRINDELKKQKKQYRLVLFLAIILMGCVVGLIAFNNNVENLRTELKEKKSIICFF